MSWFGVDGELIALPDPIKYASTRPSFNPTYTAELATEYRKALYVRDFANNVLSDQMGPMGALNSKNATAKYRIDLDISQAQFNYHHLFSDEHVLAFKLKNMHKHYVMTQDQNLIEILTAKVKFLNHSH